MRAIIIDDRDNVAVVVQQVRKNDVVETTSGPVTALDDIRTGHKIALRDIRKGSPIIKYNTEIGEASADIRKGEWVHTHNVLDTTEKICDEFAAEYRAKLKEVSGK